MEIWKDIKGYEGLYQISNLGNVKSLPKKCDLPNGHSRITIEKIMKFGTNPNGYKYVNLRKGKVPKNIRVHRLVAEHFISNLWNKKCVNHINGIKSDNREINLEWATSSENNLHARVTGLNKTTDKHRFPAKKVIDEQTGQIYESIYKLLSIVNIDSNKLYDMLNGVSKNITSYRLI
jgi:hypothetical protein